MPTITKQDFVKFFDEWHNHIDPELWRLCVRLQDIDGRVCDFKKNDESIPIEDTIKTVWQNISMKGRMDFMKVYNKVQEDIMLKMYEKIEEYEETLRKKQN